VPRTRAVSSKNRAEPKAVERRWWGLGRAPHLQGPEGDQSKAAVALGGRSASKERWYLQDVAESGGRCQVKGSTEASNRQFVLADPDGHL
jgi:hypothetical protein